jgi:hypothetical protein
MEYFFEQQPPMRFQQLAATSHQSMSKLPDYYPVTAEMYLPGVPRTRSLFGAADDELTCLVESSPKPRARKRSLCGIIGDGSGEKKEKQRRMRLSDKFTALMILIPNRTKVCAARSYLFLNRHLASYLAQWPTYVVCTVYLSSISRVYSSFVSKILPVC